MAVTETPVLYRSSDGMKFDNQADAEKHDKFVTAREEYERAQLVYGRLIVESTKTIDGVPFKNDSWHDFYALRRPFDRAPYLEKIDFSQHNYYVDECDQAHIKRWIGHNDPREWRVEELYHHKKNADAALVTAVEEYIAAVRVELEKLKDGG